MLHLHMQPIMISWKLASVKVDSNTPSLQLGLVYKNRRNKQVRTSAMVDVGFGYDHDGKELASICKYPSGRG